MTIHLGKRAKQEARTATLNVRWRQVTLRPPNSRAKQKLPSITVWAVWALEPDPPPGVERVEWLLLTTVPITTTADALERLAWYAARRAIEVWHKVLKSGCRIEEKQLESAERLRRCLTLYSVIAWRILYATMLARAAPDAPCTVLLDDDEWQGLYCRIQRVALAPERPPSLRQAVRWIAQLGGFQGRKRDGEPGVAVLWKGFQQLVHSAAMYRIMRPVPGPTNPEQRFWVMICAMGEGWGDSAGTVSRLEPGVGRVATAGVGSRWSVVGGRWPCWASAPAAPSCARSVP
ncbi:MAG: IS4 family transposase [Roseiflexaceae bacterium]